MQHKARVLDTLAVVVQRLEKLESHSLAAPRERSIEVELLLLQVHLFIAGDDARSVTMLVDAATPSTNIEKILRNRSDEINEAEHACAGGESDMDAGRLGPETSTHWALDFEPLLTLRLSMDLC